MEIINHCIISVNHSVAHFDYMFLAFRSCFSGVPSNLIMVLSYGEEKVVAVNFQQRSYCVLWSDTIRITYELRAVKNQARNETAPINIAAMCLL